MCNCHARQQRYQVNPEFEAILFGEDEFSAPFSFEVSGTKPAGFPKAPTGGPATYQQPNGQALPPAGSPANDQQFIDPRITVSAQRALMAMARSPDVTERGEATTILGLVKSGRLWGLYEHDQREPAQLAVRTGTNWWSLLAPGENAALMCDWTRPQAPPMFAMRAKLQQPAIIAAIRTTLSPWLAEMSNPAFCANAINPPAVLKVCRLGAVGQGYAPSAIQAASTGSSPSDAQKMTVARQQSRQTMTIAINALGTLLQGFKRERQGGALTGFERRVLISVGRWLKVDTAATPAARAQAEKVIGQAREILKKTLDLETTRGRPLRLERSGFNNHAQAVVNDPNLVIACGNLFFTVDGPNCRRDVITHETLHLAGLGHGGVPDDGFDQRVRIITSVQALDSADNLAQMVSEIINGRTDACMRPGD